MTRRRFARSRCALLLLTALAGCAGGDGAEAPRAAGGTARTYTLRGIVLGLPQQDDRNLRLRHEAVPEFVDSTGNQVGMDSMVMPFPVAPDLQLAGVAEGDPVEITLVVDWQADQPILITEVRELPPGTNLDLGKTSQ